MGPRETLIQKHLNSVEGITAERVLAASQGWREDLLRARLADALEEALDGWASLSNFESLDDIRRLRALLREADG